MPTRFEVNHKDFTEGEEISDPQGDAVSSCAAHRASGHVRREWDLTLLIVINEKLIRSSGYDNPWHQL